MKIYAVVDTNVWVSALISKNKDAPPVQLLRAMLQGAFTPLYHPDILEEYREVLSREKFGLDANLIEVILGSIEEYGLEVSPSPTGQVLLDMDDLIFYEVVIEKRKECDTYLVTGNIKHFPKEPFIVTPREILGILAEAFSPADLDE